MGPYHYCEAQPKQSISDLVRAKRGATLILDRHGRKLPRDDRVLVFSDAYPNRGWDTRDGKMQTPT